MPRLARAKSESGIYHIILRGANRQEIFHDNEDYNRYLETLSRYKRKSDLKVYGWCLMSNHIHLLIKEGNEELAITMKRIGVSYVGFYHAKYSTTGHLFQDRFGSENVDSEKHLTTVIRYIHQNPVKAGIVGKAKDWEWSSCRGYYHNKSEPQGLLDSELILSLFSEDEAIAFKRFKEFNDEVNEDNCMDISRKRLNDKDVAMEIERIMMGINLAQVKSLQKNQRDVIIRKAKSIEGVTQRQLARIFGVSQTLISTI